MFRLEFFCDDKHVARILHGVNGMALNLSVLPVVNAKETTDGKVVSKTPGDVVSLLGAWIKEHKLPTINAAQVKAFCREHGRSEGGYSNVIRKSVDAGLLKKAGKGTKSGYNVKTGAL